MRTLILGIFASAWLLNAAAAATGGFPDPATVDPKPTAKTIQTAVLAGGCFWCTEAVFEAVAGVEKVVSGYCGGDAATAKYKVVGSGASDHAEAIEVTFDASKISYAQLLKIFFSVAHDPTTLNRQGPDWGRQYRSAIFYRGETQKKIAEAYIAQLNAAKVFSGKIVTEVSAAKPFYAAEDYHQDFVKHNPDHGYVVVNSLPKVANLKKLYPELLKKK